MHQKRPSRKPKHHLPSPTASDPLLCGIVLAGGEGRRLRPFVHLLRRDLLPKQYVNFIGTRSMIQHTFARAEKLVPPERVFTVINESHLRFSEVQAQLSSRFPGTVIVQPENKETAPGLLLPLLHLAKRYPQSAVVVLPSDQFVLQEDELLSRVRFAYLRVQQDPAKVILLGVEPDREETEYGYIVPGKTIATAAGHEISSFIEKPDLQTARDLLRRGALWNTMVMVFRTDTMLELIRSVAPALYSAFDGISEVMGNAAEKAALQEIYRELPSVNFSKEILEPLAQRYPGRLLTVPVHNVLWSDWGTERRIVEVLRATGYMPRLNGLCELGGNRDSEPRIAPSRSMAPVKARPSRPKVRAAIAAPREVI